MANTPLRAVIDTNVWISGLLTRSGTAAQLTRQVVLTGQAVFSAPTFAELKDRLWRPKFDRYVTLEQRTRFLRDLESIAGWAEVPPGLAATTYCRDADDDKFIHTALAAQAPWLITGDQDLLMLSDALLPQGVRILSPSDFLATQTRAGRA